MLHLAIILTLFARHFNRFCDFFRYAQKFINILCTVAGFGDYSSFYKAYKKYFGSPPSKMS